VYGCKRVRRDDCLNESGRWRSQPPANRPGGASHDPSGRFPRGVVALSCASGKICCSRRDAQLSRDGGVDVGSDGELKSLNYGTIVPSCREGCSWAIKTGSLKLRNLWRR
jgi:hypothetical protein